LGFPGAWKTGEVSSGCGWPLLVNDTRGVHKPIYIEDCHNSSWVPIVFFFHFDHDIISYKSYIIYNIYVYNTTI
jgi:hypothetical protein